MKKIIPIVIIIAGLVIVGTFIFTNYKKCPTGTSPAASGTQILSTQEAGEKLINFINDNILKEQSTASLIEVLEESGLYKVKFNVENQEVEWQMSKDGRFVYPQVIDLTKIEETAEETSKAVGNFSISSDEVCKEDGKPIVYFFGSQGCPHCVWEHPIVEKVLAKFEGYIAFHNNMDSEEDSDVFQKYSPGSIPTLVLGCKYYRVGSGEGVGEEEETKNLTSLVCDLTDNQPANVCQ